MQVDSIERDGRHPDVIVPLLFALGLLDVPVCELPGLRAQKRCGISVA